MDFTYMQVVDLRRFLQERGVSCSFHWKYHLERLCKLAHEMNLEVISLKMMILIHKFQSPEDAGLLKIVKLTLELLEIKIINENLV